MDWKLGFIIECRPTAISMGSDLNFQLSKLMCINSITFSIESNYE